MPANLLFSRLLSWSIAIGLGGALSPTVAADLPVRRTTDPLVGFIQRLDERPADPAQAVLSAGQRLASSIRQLEQYLAAAGPDKSAAWSSWLDVPKLKQEVASPRPDLSALHSIEERFYENKEGLERPAFVAVRRQLRAFLTAHEYAAADAPGELFRRRLAELDQHLTRLSLQPLEADAHRAGLLLAWFEALDDNSAALAREARSRLCSPNAVAQASARLANLLLQRNVQQRNYISETVLGSFTRGLAITQGQVSMAMVPSDDHGTLEVRLQGRVMAPANVAERGRITVYNTSFTSLDARKQVSINDEGLRLARATASGATSIRIQDIDAPRIAQRIAWRRASRLLPEAEALTSRRAESEAAARLDQQAGASLGNVNEVFCQKIRAPLIRLNALPAQMRFWTDAAHLRLSLAQHNETQLAAAGPPPSLSASYDLAGSVHESMINNLCESLLSGRTIDDETWLDMMHLLLGSQPRPLWVHDRAERWAVVLAGEQPLSAQFQDDQLGLILRLSEVQRGDQTLRQAVEIEARFIPQITADGPELVRDGELEIRMTGDLDLESSASLHAFLARKFGAVFPPVLHFHGLMPPTGGSLGKLRQLTPAEFGSTGGWLRLAYQLEAAQ
jgi:hypothetical protein